MRVHQRDALAEYGVAANTLHRVLRIYAEAAADLASENLPAAELLELARLTLHRSTDNLIDELALLHPSARRLIVRGPRYADLVYEARCGR